MSGGGHFAVFGPFSLQLQRWCQTHKTQLILDAIFLPCFYTVSWRFSFGGLTSVSQIVLHNYSVNHLGRLVWAGGVDVKHRGWSSPSNKRLNQKVSADKVQSCVFIIPHNQFYCSFLCSTGLPLFRDACKQCVRMWHKNQTSAHMHTHSKQTCGLTHTICTV